MKVGYFIKRLILLEYKVFSHDGMKNSIDNDGILFYEKGSK